MSTRKDKARQELSRLKELLARDFLEMSDEEIREEVNEIHGDADKFAAEAREILEKAIAADAQDQQPASGTEPDKRSNVVRLPLERKRAILEFLTAKGPLELTLAARGEKDADADIDGLLEDLVELGLIDEDGNIL